MRIVIRYGIEPTLTDQRAINRTLRPTDADGRLDPRRIEQHVRHVFEQAGYAAVRNLIEKGNRLLKLDRAMRKGEIEVGRGSVE